MKTIEAEHVIREILKKQKTCSFLDINKWKENYNEQHPDEYVAACRDEIHFAIDQNHTEFYWNSEEKFIIKQEKLSCPICGIIHLKYPNVKQFVLMSGRINKINDAFQNKNPE